MRTIVALGMQFLSRYSNIVYVRTKKGKLKKLTKKKQEVTIKQEDALQEVYNALKNRGKLLLSSIFMDLLLTRLVVRIGVLSADPADFSVYF
jgi:hypothetical protein